jgi:cobalamin biosynthesis protein CbiG
MASDEELSARYAIGIGARSGVEARELVALIEKLCEASPPAPIALFTIESKRGESGLHDAARALSMEITFLPLAALRARKDELLTHSPRVEALTGVGCVAEAVALVGAGAGSRLLGPRLAGARATCAIARNALDEAP